MTLKPLHLFWKQHILDAGRVLEFLFRLQVELLLTRIIDIVGDLVVDDEGNLAPRLCETPAKKRLEIIM